METFPEQWHVSFPFLNIPDKFSLMAAIAAMKALIVKDGKFLALELEIGRRRIWDLPGGKVEDAEEPMQTLAREVEEETSLKPAFGQPVGVYWFHRKTDGLLSACTVFKCTVPADAKVILPHKSNESIASCKWLSKDEFLKAEFEAPKSLKELVKNSL